MKNFFLDLEISNIFYVLLSYKWLEISYKRFGKEILLLVRKLNFLITVSPPIKLFLLYHPLDNNKKNILSGTILFVVLS